MASQQVIAFVMAGGQGTRLRPFTDELPKPALPFGGRCRIIDFVLANLQHSGVSQIFVLLQYKPEALIEHLRRYWPGVVPLLPERAYVGTADAVAQNIWRIDEFDADLVAVFAADHVYRMDVRQMVEFHLSRHAQATIAALPVPIARASEFGVLVTDTDSRVVGFQEKPSEPAPSPDDLRSALVSMGNYLFGVDTLRRALKRTDANAEFDFGRDVLPALVRGGQVFAYDFRRNLVPGVQPCEERAYWRDVGTVRAYREAQMDARGRRPRFALNNRYWPVSRTLAPVEAYAI